MPKDGSTSQALSTSSWGGTARYDGSVRQSGGRVGRLREVAHTSTLNGLPDPGRDYWRALEVRVRRRSDTADEARGPCGWKGNGAPSEILRTSENRLGVLADQQPHAASQALEKRVH